MKKSNFIQNNPFNEPCKYIAICTPVLSIEIVNREQV